MSWWGLHDNVIVWSCMTFIEWYSNYCHSHFQQCWNHFCLCCLLWESVSGFHLLFPRTCAEAVLSPINWLVGFWFFPILVAKIFSSLSRVCLGCICLVLASNWKSLCFIRTCRTSKISCCGLQKHTNNNNWFLARDYWCNNSDCVWNWKHCESVTCSKKCKAYASLVECMKASVHRYDFGKAIFQCFAWPGCCFSRAQSSLPKQRRLHSGVLEWFLAGRAKSSRQCESNQEPRQDFC